VTSVKISFILNLYMLRTKYIAYGLIRLVFEKVSGRETWPVISQQ